MATRRVVNLKDFSKVLGDYSKLSIEKKRKAVLAGLARSISDLVAASPVDTGLYAQSWAMIPTELGAIIGNYAPYAGVIEDGARPHTMPIGPLLGWAKRVLKSSSQPPDYDSHVWALAVYTQKKILEQGQQPKHIMQNMIPKIIENIREELRRAA